MYGEGGAGHMTLDELHALERQLENWMYYTRSAKVKRLFIASYFSVSLTKIYKNPHMWLQLTIGVPTNRCRSCFRRSNSSEKKLASNHLNFGPNNTHFFFP